MGLRPAPASLPRRNPGKDEQARARFPKTGTVTASNSSGITGGAAAVGAELVKNNGLKPLARSGGRDLGRVDLRVMGIGPVPALAKMQARHGLRLQDFDLVEVNEALAAQVIACDRELHIDR